MTNAADARGSESERCYVCWAVLESAPDIKGAWVAHCPEFGALAQASSGPGVSYGAAAAKAVALLLEATKGVVRDDLREGLDPRKRRAPANDWSDLPQLPAAPGWRALDELEEFIDSQGSECRWTVALQVQFSLVEHAAEPVILFASLRVVQKPGE